MTKFINSYIIRLTNGSCFLLFNCPVVMLLTQQSYFLCLHKEFRDMVFNATFNNISVILWRSVLLVEETRMTRRKQPTCRKSLTGKVCLTNIRSCCKFYFMYKEHNIPHFTTCPRYEWHLEGAVTRSCEASRKCI